MRVTLLVNLLVLLFGNRSTEQSYHDSIYSWQQHYKEEFITTERSPLTAADTGLLRFYPPSEVYRIPARFTIWEDHSSLLIPTYNQKTKAFKKYGYLDFEIQGKEYRLYVYQNISYLDKDSLHLFLPFTDATNAETTYGGGRYIDLSVTDITDGKAILDFNKAYNPYCAFSGGYSCPVPPEENRLTIAIHAGEQIFAGQLKD